MGLRLRKFISILGVSFLFLLILYYIFRSSILSWGIEKVASKLKEYRGANLEIKASSFSGFNSVSIKGIYISQGTGDTLFFADSMQVRISIWALMSGTLRLTELSISNAQLVISYKDSISNYNGFIHADKEKTQPQGNSYATFFKRTLDRIFNFAPQKVFFKDIRLIYIDDHLQRRYDVLEFISDEKSVHGILQDKFLNCQWNCTGTFSQRKHIIDVIVYPGGPKKPYVPLLNEILGLSFSFDTLHVSVDNYSLSHDVFSTHGIVSLNNMISYHKKISGDTVKIASAYIDFRVLAGKTNIILDSSSVVSFGQLRFRPFFSINTLNGKEYILNIHTDKIKSNDFFSSLPAGMFDDVRDIEASGSLKFDLNFKINSLIPDSLLFECSLKKENFHIKKYGSSDLGKMNGEFIHDVYEKDKFVRSFPVGTSNSFFNTLDSISPNFINAVLTSEDGSFFNHNGFNEEAFRQSIAANFKAGKFVRGGSTISMQLVKNVFLSRKKTIARKAEEALLVWLIESNRLYSKERMLEVYMNVIELGPDIYGIGEASSFYFNKHASALTLPESIFLASLLPHPKWFKYSFDKSGNLKPEMASYYKIISDFMLKKNLITQGEHDLLLPHIDLTGPAREMVVPTDSIPVEEDDQ